MHAFCDDALCVVLALGDVVLAHDLNDADVLFAVESNQINLLQQLLLMVLQLAHPDCLSGVCT
jgi:hypothetical protein